MAPFICDFQSLVRVLLACGLHFLILSAPSSGHSFLIRPRGDFHDFRKPECRIGGPSHAPDDHCPGPCIARDSWQYRPLPSIRFRRGQRVHVAWGRNNHHGGFVRFALVPIIHRMNHTAHESMSFHYACFDSGISHCPYGNCGTDVRDLMCKTSVKIPTAYPDGEYVLGFSWFGGVVMGESEYGDYWSCRHVTIRGGPLTASYDPIFHPGQNLPYRQKVCQSTVSRVGICRTEPCFGYKASYLRPYAFSKGRKPQSILARWMMDGSDTPMPPRGTHWHKRRKRRPAAPPSRATTRPTHTLTPVTDTFSHVGTSPSPSGISHGTPILPIMTRGPTPSTSLLGYPEHPNQHGRQRATLHGLSVFDLNARKRITISFPARLSFGTHTPQVTFVALTNEHVRSVRFYIDQKFERVESEMPYACFGDSAGRLHAWTNPITNRMFRVTVVVEGVDGTTSDIGHFNIFLSTRE